MCFKIFVIIFLPIIHHSETQIVLFEEKHFLADLLQLRKVLKEPPIIEHIRDKDEKMELPQLRREEAQPGISGDQSASENTPPKIVYLGKVCFSALAKKITRIFLLKFIKLNFRAFFFTFFTREIIEKQKFQILSVDPSEKDNPNDIASQVGDTK